MRRRMGTELGLVQGLPLAAGAEHVEDRVGTRAIRDTRSPPAKAMRINVNRQQRLQHGPLLIGDAKPGRRTIIGRSLARALQWVDVLLAHSPIIAGYSDRLLPYIFCHTRAPAEDVSVG